MKLNERSKKRFAIIGGVILCGVLAVAIGSRFGGTQGAGQAVTKTAVPNEGVEVAVETTVYATESMETEKLEPALVVDIEPKPVKDMEKKETPAASIPVQTDRNEQVIQPTPEKPSVPPDEVLKNPTQKPDGQIVEEKPEAIPHEDVIQPSETPAQPGEPQAGDTQSGQIYIPGFGWVEDQGGGGSGTTAGDMYENGNKIGIMD